MTGGLFGTAVGAVGVFAASRRYPGFARLTIPFRAFLIASSGSFAGELIFDDQFPSLVTKLLLAILSADRWSRSFEANQHPDLEYTQKQQKLLQKLEASKTKSEQWIEWAQENKYGIVAGSWAVSIAVAFALVSRNPFLSGQQKLVQARVYAQGLTLAVVIASLALETRERTQGTTVAQSEVDMQKNQWKGPLLPCILRTVSLLT